MIHSVACQQFLDFCIHLLPFNTISTDNIKTIYYERNCKWVSLCGPALQAKLCFTKCPHALVAYLSNLFFSCWRIERRDPNLLQGTETFPFPSASL